jgi:hypothetical protein
LQTLGLTDPPSRQENRLKALFWPSIKTGSDVDALGTQGYWICTIVALLSFIFHAALGHVIVGIVSLLLFYLGGVGVRERSRYAASVVLLIYALDTLSLKFALLTPGGILRLFLLVLLLSNLRATWIASRWSPQSADAVPPTRLTETWSDKFADTLPALVWPSLRMFYYVFSACILLLVVRVLVASALS